MDYALYEHHHISLQSPDSRHIITPNQVEMLSSSFVPYLLLLLLLFGNGGLIVQRFGGEESVNIQE